MNVVDLLWLVLALPLAGFVSLALIGHRLGERGAAAIGVATVGLTTAVAAAVALVYWAAPGPAAAVRIPLWSWVAVAGFRPDVALYLDALSLVMVLVVSAVGFLIHLYAVEYMRGEEGFARFFAYMNLFVASMLVLVLADNLFLLYLGWEGVGLCSFLLIGFWYRDRDNAAAARKAFVVTRIGDTAMAVGLFLIFQQLGTLDIQQVLARAGAQWPVGSGLALAVALLLLGGAVGKSAQLPLQTWLPDAMAGPTPVSALIHAATMVTAGFYLIARSHGLFELAPLAMQAVAWVGALTLLLAGLAALAQRDIKRVLAYSTISQIGYMFLALGVGAWSAAVFHFATHAVFKALLFMGAGAVIVCCHHRQDMFQLGGLRRRLPVVFWTFLIGSASLAALPLVTSGFYSKDLILWRVWQSSHGSLALWGMGLAGAALTALYTGRMLFITFWGRLGTAPSHRPGLSMKLPLVVLAAAATLLGFIELPHNLGHFTPLSDALRTALPAAAAAMPGRPVGPGAEWALQGLAALLAIGGLLLAWRWYTGERRFVERLLAAAWGRRMHRLLAAGWGFDQLYDWTLVRPYRCLARANKGDLLDGLARLTAGAVQSLHHALSTTQTGRLRHYAIGLAAGALLVLAAIWTVTS